MHGFAKNKKPEICNKLAYSVCYNNNTRTISIALKMFPYIFRFRLNNLEHASGHEDGLFSGKILFKKIPRKMELNYLIVFLLYPVR